MAMFRVSLAVPLAPNLMALSAAVAASMEAAGPRSAIASFMMVVQSVTVEHAAPRFLLVRRPGLLVVIPAVASATGSLKNRLSMRIPSKALNLVANACLVVASGTLGVTVWYKYFHGQAVPRQTVPRPAGLPIQPGSSAPPVEGMSYGSHEQSLLLFLSTACRYCEASVPFYNKLHGVALRSSGKWNVVGLFLQPADQVAAFTARVNMEAKLLPEVDFRRFGVTSTPTVLLVDRLGIVRQVWLGASRASESGILSKLDSSHVD